MPVTRLQLVHLFSTLFGFVSRALTEAPALPAFSVNVSPLQMKQKNGILKTAVQELQVRC
jgi:hypothetical protein